MRYLTLFCTILLSGCVNLFPASPPPAKSVTLHPHFRFPSYLKPVKWTLAVAEPFTTDPFDSKRILLNIENDKGIRILETLAEVEWVDRFPVVFQQHLISAFEKSGLITGIGQEEEDFQTCFTLQINIKAAEIILTDLADQKVLIELSARLISSKDHKVMAQHTFRKLSPVRERTQKALLEGYQELFGDTISEIVLWCFREGAKAFSHQSKPECENERLQRGNIKSLFS